MVTAYIPPALPPAPPAIVIRIDGKETGEQLGKRLNTRNSFQPIRANAGVSYFELDWDGNAPQPDLRFEHGVHSFTVPNLFGLRTETGDSPIIQFYDLSFAIHPRNKTPHETARLFVMTLLQTLQSAGWQQHYWLPGARLLRRSALLAGTEPLDARYVLTPEEWLDLGLGRNKALNLAGDGQLAQWNLQANGIYMEIKVQRQVSSQMPQGTGAYLVSMELRSEMQEIKSNITIPSNGDWVSAWKQYLPKAAQWRHEREAKALAKGLKIDTQYRDPPLLALQALRPPVLSARVGQPAPKGGWWKASSTNAQHWSLPELAKAAPRLVKQGQPLPSLGTPSLTPQQLAERDASLLWTWVRDE